jgi:transposase InsO family protein
VTRYALIDRLAETHPVRAVAEALGVSVSGYYDWKDRPASPRAIRREEIAAAVADVFEEHHRIPGSRKIAEELAARDVQACRNTVAELMRERSLRSRAQRSRRFTTTTDSDHAEPIAPNLLDRDFAASEPDRKWVSDITYVPTDRGWAYLATVMDLHSRRIVGWAVGETLATTLVLSALDDALAKRRPKGGLTHHSDRGCQYASAEHRRRLAEAGIECSMSRRGNCWDNACAERFFNAYKNEWANHHRYRNAEEVRRSAFAYIEIYYNRRRRHETLGYLSPVEFEERQRGATAA